MARWGGDVTTPVGGRRGGAGATHPLDAHSQIPFRRPAVVWVLLAGTLVLTAASVAVQISIHFLDRPFIHGVVPMFDMNGEANVPAWFSTALFLLCAGLVAMLALGERRRGETRWRYSAGIALLLAAGSIDEAATIHETGARFLGGGGNGYMFVLPASIVVAAVGAALWRFAADLPATTRRGLAIAAGTFLLGAFVLEIVELELVRPGDMLHPRFGMGLLGTAQDLFELLGLVILADTLLRYAGRQGYRLHSP
jgi:hypothetical protein